MLIDKDGLNPGIRLATYTCDASHAVLAEDGWKGSGANIGAQGENLTISFLSLNRAALSIKLLESIQTHLPNFKGEILVIDNASEPAELAQVEAFLATMPQRNRVVRLEKNYGVGGGRNKTMEFVQTDWVMFLDNDIFFLRDFLWELQREIAMLGVHFINLPLLDSDRSTLFAKGGHIYLSFEDNEWHIGAGSAMKQQKQQATMGQNPFLCTFLFGGASCMKRETFLSLGGFHPDMFIGFEDLEFSIRLFRAGMKVGTSGQVALVHDHAKVETVTQNDYERQRFSRQHLYKSAKVLEDTYGFRVWGEGAENWLRERQRELGIVVDDIAVPETTVTPVATQSSNRPKVALVIDAEGWAFHNIALQLEKNLSDRFEFLIIPANLFDDMNTVLMMTDDCHITHFFWREHLRQIFLPYNRDRVAALGMSFSAFEQRYLFGRILSTAIYDHLYIEAEEVAKRAPIFHRLLKGYYVASKKLETIYRQTDYPAPAAVLQDGVDLKMFTPRNLDRLQTVGQRPTVIGWVGNSKWNSSEGGEDFKGLHSILLPALDILRARGHAIEFRPADRQVRHVPHGEMPDYYSTIDLYVCASKIEGTPNPVLESMACGIPIVTTDVGIVPEAFGPLQQQYILPSRDVESMVATLERLLKRPQDFATLSAENLQRIKPWDWPLQCEKFADYFHGLLGVVPLQKAG